MSKSYNPAKVIVALLLLFSVYSCKKSLFNAEEQRLTGQWKFQRVTFRENLSYIVNEVTGDYAGDLLQLKDDKSLVYTETGMGKQSGGSWQMKTFSYTDPTTGEDITDRTLDIYVNEGSNFHSTDFSTTKSKLTIKVNKDDGVYTYYLVK